MKSFWVRVAIVILSVFCHVPRIHSQVLNTGETGGRGSQSLMISANAIQPNDFGRLSNFWLQYGRGVSDRVFAGIVGMSIPVGRALTFFVDFNPGRAQRSGGTGVMYVLPSKIVGDASR